MQSWLKIFFLITANLLCRSQELRISASVGPLENVFRPVSELLFQKEEIRLVLKQCTPLDALKDLEEGRADAVAAAMDMDTWLALAKAQGQPVANYADLQAHSLGKDVVQLITHPDLPVVALQEEEVQGIYSGRIRNWKTVDGPDLAISILECEGLPEMFRALEVRLPKGVIPAKPLQRVKTLPELRILVAATRGAVAFGPRAANHVEVNAPIIPEVALPMVLLTKGEPSKPVKKLLKFIAGKHGRKLVMN